MPTYIPSQLFQAIRDEDVKLVTTIVTASPVMLQVRDERGSTPLVLASYLGQLETTKALVEAGADLNEIGGSGTALMGVVVKGYDELLRYFIDRGANVNVALPNGATALTMAEMFHREEMAEVLKSAGAK